MATSLKLFFLKNNFKDTECHLFTENGALRAH